MKESAVVKIEQLTGRGMPIRGNDIDTDRIIPARFMKCVTFKGLGEYAFYDQRFDTGGAPKGHPFDDSKYKGHDILLVNKNFGCGSSREHAPQSLADYGIRGVIGESFAEIFAGNCTAMGIPAVSVSEEDIELIMDLVEKAPETVIKIDLENMKVQAGDSTFNFVMPESYRQSLLDGSWDSTAILLEGIEDIRAAETTIPYLAGF